MEKNQMKNIVVLKNLPSNLVEEAIIILKSKKTAKKFEYIDKNEPRQKQENGNNSKDYIIREAESVITSYISAIEKKDKKKQTVGVEKKYKKLKIYSIIITVAFIIAWVL